MTSVAEKYVHVIGVDTHAKNHVFTIITGMTGQVIQTRSFSTTPAGLKRALAWVKATTDPNRLVVIEGIGSYGATLAVAAISQAMDTVEAGTIPARLKRGQGKTDELDSIRIARSVINLTTSQLRHPRTDQGIRDALRILTTARDELVRDKTSATNALIALLRQTNLGIDTRHRLSQSTIHTITRWRPRTDDTLVTRTARNEAIRLATRILDCGTQLTNNLTQLTNIITATSYQILLDQPGIGPISAAHIIVAWGNPNRIHSEASFASLAGVNPIPISSGNTHRHRLNKAGDRQLNKAIHTIALTRMTHHPQTRTYTTKRTQEGKTHKDIRRILKRYITRHIYRLLNTIPTT